jgi:hypothetical protein
MSCGKNSRRQTFCSCKKNALCRINASFVLSDQNGAPLPGAVFTVRTACGKAIAQAASSQAGQVGFCLKLKPCTTYTITTDEWPTGYCPDGNHYLTVDRSCGFTIDGNDPEAFFPVFVLGGQAPPINAALIRVSAGTGPGDGTVAGEAGALSRDPSIGAYYRIGDGAQAFPIAKNSDGSFLVSGLDLTGMPKVEIIQSQAGCNDSSAVFN